jgi:predicted house-cleaning noncanonical NTP pyrophosphatase (MazG superfamily)
LSTPGCNKPLRRAALFVIVEACLNSKFNKLVRDKIVEHQLASGAVPVYHQLAPDEHKKALINKILEESQEILQAPPEEIAMEIADVQQALDDLKDQYGLTNEAIAEAQARKNEKNGAFRKGIFVDYVEVDDSSEWAAYYRANADRYPEIG